MIRVLILMLAALSFSMVIGAGAYEHRSVVPRWSAGPPASLTMFQGPYGLAPERFWRPIHPITMLLLAAALAFAWPTPGRAYLAVALLGYAVVLVATFTYFVPELLAIIGTPAAASRDAALATRAARWEMLSLTRLGVMMMLAFVLLAGIVRTTGGRLID